MASPPPTTVLLPTTEWTDACEQVAAQLRAGDELVVVCDDASDPVARRGADDDGLPDRVRVVAAGEPEGCSGKANAVAAGMEAATTERLVWTDDDFRHPPDWLAGLHAAYDEHGPVSELPFFVGRDPLATLLEPVYSVGGTLGVSLDDIAWGGAVIFERDDLDEAAFLRDLRRTVSDDGLLTEYLDLRSLRRVRRVEVGGSLRRTLERHTRFTKIVRWHDPWGTVVMSVVGTATALAGLVFPVTVALLATLAYAGIYAAVGVRRWTFLLGYPAMLLQPPLQAYALGRRSFVWAGRRYRWRSKFDVEVESAD